MSVPSPGPDGSAGGLPVDGTTGQVLTKLSNADFDADWQNAGGGGLPAGGSIGQTIINTGPGAGTWQNAPPAAPLAHAPSHESGGLDPITNLGMPFRVKDGADGFVDFTDDGVIPGSPVFTVDGIPVSADKIVLRANGGNIEFYDNADALQGYQNIGGVHGGYGIAVGDGGVLDAFTLINDGTGAGKLRLQTADQAGYFDLTMANEALEFLHADGSSLYVGAGTAFYLYDGLANPYVEFEAAALSLNHYDAAGTGTLLSSLTLADGAATLVGNDPTGALTGSVEVGAGVTVTGQDAPGALKATASLNSAGAVIGFIDLNTNDLAEFSVFSTGIRADWSPAGSLVARLELDDDGVHIGATGQSVGVLGATPYGQDAYLAPLDDNLSALTTLVDLITAENETRTRINSINGYLISRGWELAA